MKCLQRVALGLFVILIASPVVAQVDFGTVKIGGNKVSGIDLKCPATPGQFCVPVGAVQIQGTNAGEFKIIGDTCTGISLPSGGGCRIQITFTPQKPPGTKTAAAIFILTTGEVFITTPLSGIAEGSKCKVDALTPITDNDALQFEAVAQSPSGPLFSLYFPSVGLNLDLAVASFENDLYNLFGLIVSRSSGYRPSAYQAHLYELSKKSLAINQAIKDPEQKEACGDLKLELDREVKTHGITPGKVNPPGSSQHELVPALAVDLNGVRSAPARQIAEAAESNGLTRSCGLADPVHFSLFGTPCSQVIRGRVESPVNILITDSKGRKVGYDPATNSIVNEVGAKAFYSGPGTEPQIIDIGAAEAGEYVLTGVGTGIGPYKLTLERLSGDGAVLESKTLNGNVTLGQKLSLSVSLPSSVHIDIKPGERPNSVNLKSKGVIPVAILSSATFDAMRQVYRSSLTFGRTGAERSLAKPPVEEDVNGDGFIDLICHFETQSTGFQADDVEGVLKGKLINNTPIQGIDWIRIVP
jgi:hypothetical protein